uniref:Uncharacterized protein n=1 Tax=Arundo donax TaxID=35708 RepID=A0A0A9HGU5_ARUDO
MKRQIVAAHFCCRCWSCLVWMSRSSVTAKTKVKSFMEAVGLRWLMA